MKTRFFYVLSLLIWFLFFPSQQPLLAQITLVGENIQQQAAAPGEQYAGSVMIHNESDSALTVRIYQDGITALTSFDNGTDIITIDRSNAGWVKHAQSRMTIQSGEVAKVQYQIIVPLKLDTEPPTGTYWSSLSVDVVALGASEFMRPYSRHHLVELATQIEGTGNKQVAINTLKLVEGSDGKKLQALMVNTGDLVVQPQVWFELYDVSGELKERIQGASKAVFPGGFDRSEISVSHLRPGIYEAQILIDTGNDQIFGTSFTLDMTDLGTIAQSESRRTTF